jgi:hypothetical protein
MKTNERTAERRDIVAGERRRYYFVRDAAGAEHLCTDESLRDTLRALPGWRGFRQVKVNG